MSGAIDNGQRLPVAFGSYEGEAGIVERPEGLRDLAFFATLRSMRKVETGTINGVEHTVLSVAASTHVTGMVVLTVRLAS